MKIFKIAIIVILILAALPFIVALFIPQYYAVEREVIIDQPHSQVYGYTKYLKNQDNFSKWSLMDPQMKKSYSGTDGEVGFVAGWESENPDVGIGEQEITGIKEGKRIDYELRFKEPFEASDMAYMEFEALNDAQTKVIWGFDGHMAYPMNAMLLFMDMESMVGNDFEQGLQTLKKILED